MEVLLIIALFICPQSQARDLERFERRISGFSEHLKNLDELEVRRVAWAQKQKEIREKQNKAYETLRDSFRRPQVSRNPQLLADFEASQEIFQARQREKQEAYAARHMQELKEIEKRAQSIKPQEYDLNGDVK